MSLPPIDFSPQERAQLRGAFLRLIPQSDEVAKSLYAHLFERLSDARGLFHGPMDEQRDKLVRMLALMLDAMDRPETFAEACRASGARHGGYGARAEHYAPLGEALVEALRETARPSPEEEALWLRLYGHVARLMVEGADEPLQ